MGGNIASGEYKLTTAEGIANMLSPAWMEGDGVTADPVQPPGIPQDRQLVYTPYSWLYKNNYEPIRKLGMKFALTESNDYLIGVPGASNSFASALWALDYMHWWVEHGASGVNFQNGTPVGIIVACAAWSGSLPCILLITVTFMYQGMHFPDTRLKIPCSF